MQLQKLKGDIFIMTYTEKNICINSFLAEGHTVKEASQEFHCSEDNIRSYVRCADNQEKVLRGIRLGEYRRQLKQGLMFAGYMATIHTVSETAEHFQVSTHLVYTRLKLLEESGKFEYKLKKAEAGKRVANKHAKRR